MKQNLKENYIRFFGNLTEHDGMGRKKGTLKEKINENLTPEFIDRIEGLSNEQDLRQLKETLKNLMADWIDEGFEVDDIIDYVTGIIEIIRMNLHDN